MIIGYLDPWGYRVQRFRFFFWFCLRTGPLRNGGECVHNFLLSRTKNSNPAIYIYTYEYL